LQSLQLYTFQYCVRKLLPFSAQMLKYTNLRTLQGYIIIIVDIVYILRILQHFATKLRNFTLFSMLFLGTYFFFCQDKKLVYNGSCLLKPVLRCLSFFAQMCCLNMGNVYLIETKSARWWNVKWENALLLKLNLLKKRQ
jgi:hypothetical protein